MVRRGSTVRVRQRALEKASKWPFLLPGCDTHVPRRAFNLSPKPVPGSQPGCALRLNADPAKHRAPPEQGEGRRFEATVGREFRVERGAQARSLVVKTGQPISARTHAQ